MAGWTFIPENTDGAKSKALAAPWFEDARADIAPYYSTDKPLKDAQKECLAEFKKLGAVDIYFQPGKFSVNAQDRSGFVIEFTLNSAPGRIQVAGLPMRLYSSRKEIRVRVQCLMNVRDWLKAAVTMQVFSPDTSPLIPYLLVPGANGQQYTVAEYILSKGNLPMLASQSVTVERE